jgi:hypothetical protein
MIETYSAEAAAFAPRLFTEYGALRYEDGRVTGALVVGKSAEGKSTLVIYDWESEDPGNGHTIPALTWLRERYDVITASGIGELDEDGVGDIATIYWEHMRAKGLVDILILDNGTELQRLPEIPPPAGP